MKLSPMEKWKAGKRALKPETTTLNSVEDLMRLMMDGKRRPEDRRVNPTQLAYLHSDAQLKAYMGPAGSGKSVVGCTEILLKALLLPGTKWVVCRRDYNDLKDTTMRTMQNILNNLPEGTLLDRLKAAPEKWYIRPIVAGPNGKVTEPSEITFMGLSDALGSYEFTGGFVDELDEVEQARWDELKMRLRWKPTPDFPDENFTLGAAFNPPAMTHWLYTACTGLNPQGEKVGEPTITLFRPEKSENQRNLRKGYYTEMGNTLTEELRMRLVDGQWGAVFPGDPVIRQFTRKLHVAKGLKFRGGTLFRFWDFGYNRPCVLFVQIHTDGRMQVLREYLGHQIEGTKFIEGVLARTSDWFPEAKKFVDYGDPAVAQHKDTGSMLALLNNAGVLMRYQRTPFDLSIQLLRKRFESIIEQEPAILIDSSCVVLADGLAGGYHLKEDGVTPKKDGYYDHEVDALRYGVFNVYGIGVSSNNELPASVAYRAMRKAL